VDAKKGGKIARKKRTYLQVTCIENRRCPELPEGAKSRSSSQGGFTARGGGGVWWWSVDKNEDAGTFHELGKGRVRRIVSLEHTKGGKASQSWCRAQANSIAREVP